MPSQPTLPPLELPAAWAAQPASTLALLAGAALTRAGRPDGTPVTIAGHLLGLLPMSPVDLLTAVGAMPAPAPAPAPVAPAPVAPAPAATPVEPTAPETPPPPPDPVAYGPARPDKPAMVRLEGHRTPLLEHRATFRTESGSLAGTAVWFAFVGPRFDGPVPVVEFFARRTRRTKGGKLKPERWADHAKRIGALLTEEAATGGQLSRWGTWKLIEQTRGGKTVTLRCLEV